MVLGLNTNLFAQTALGGLSKSSRTIGSIFERLSSGQRINRASDDAAGLAVSSTLDARIRVTNRGRLNVADGISALNIVDSTLGSIAEVLTRMQELAASAANGSLSSSQRRTLSQEYQTLEKEIRRITGETTFNGIQLLQADASQSSSSTTLSTTDSLSVEGLSSDGRYITYRASGGQIYQMDRQRSVTTTIASSSTARAPVSSADGAIVIYQNGNDLFKWDRRTGSAQQLTNAQGAETYAGLSVSADGGSVAFSAVTQYQNGMGASGGTSTGTQRIFKMDLSSGLISTVARNVTGVFQSFQLSSDGSRLVFTSIANLVGLNADGNREVYVADYGGSSPSYTQVTQTTGTNITQARIADGGQVYIATTLDLGGVNPGGYSNIMRYDMGSGTYQRITNNSTGNAISNLTVNNDGSLISFVTSANLTGGNSLNLPQIFQIDAVSGTTRQATDLTNSSYYMNSALALSRDGNTVLWNFTDGMQIPTTYDVADLGTTSKQIVINTASGATGSISVSISDLLSTLRGLGAFAITAQSGAQGALDRITANLELLNSMRGRIGAGLSRLESASRLLSDQSVALTGARGQITDIDTAGEVAALTRERILQQTGTALLNTARLQPQIVLGLLSFN
ncbi:MAG: hypothetical protein K1X79_09065 [Oligoflexia bacterium]|nr:hypothetical protein [Oligoflexia bacterium]